MVRAARGCCNKKVTRNIQTIVIIIIIIIIICKYDIASLTARIFSVTAVLHFHTVIVTIVTIMNEITPFLCISSAFVDVSLFLVMKQLLVLNSGGKKEAELYISAPL